MVISTPANWDAVSIQPDPGIPDDGFYDAKSSLLGISPDNSLGGFGVQFEFFGVGVPGSQRFDIIDPVTFNSIANCQAVNLRINHFWVYDW